MHLITGFSAALELAATQHQLLRSADLRRLGLTYPQIQRLADDGALERVIAGLFRLPGTRTRRQDMAAITMRHRGATISHLSALELSGVACRRPKRPQITLSPGRTSRGSLGSIHRSALWPEARTEIAGIPTTTLSRAVVDACEHLRLVEIRDLLTVVFGRGLVEVEDVVETMLSVEQGPGRVGLGRLRTALDVWVDAVHPESVAEAVLFRRISEAHIPVPETQHEIFSEDGLFLGRVDLAWPEARVAREYDSRAFHGADRIEADERRRGRIEAAGWRIGVLHRGHLVPGREDWLRALAADLGVPFGS